MCAAVDSGSIKRTQEELGKYVKKPPLTDKLLNKPPFRFLHDVINAIVTETGFLAGLFTDEELSSQNIKDKEAKVAFLQKCIDATCLATGETYSVRPSKIVAGHDVDKTNEWLQGLGRAISKNIDSTEAVQKILSGAKPEKPKKTEKEKSEKKTDKVKKEVAAKNGSFKDKDPKPKKNPKPKVPLPNSNKDLKPSNKSPKSNKSPNSSRERKSSKDPRNDLVGKASTKPSDDKGSPIKSSSRRERSKDEKEGKKRDKSRREGKEEKEKGQRKPKGDRSPEKGRSSKSRAASRAGHVKESGKENSPPHEKVEKDEMIPNGHATLDEIESGQKPKSARPPSARPGVRTSAAALDGGMELGGPESLIQVEGDLQQQKDVENEEGEMPVISSLVGENNNNIDPAILKAMAPGNDGSLANEDEDHLNPPSAPEPPDSGVGSLESPKHPPVQLEEQNSSSVSASKGGPQSLREPSAVSVSKGGPQPLQEPSALSASKGGPQPLRALEQFGDDVSASPPSSLSQPPIQDKEEQPVFTREKSARPRTGRRSARPPSARPAPPRIRERREIPKEELPRPATSKPVANVILSSNAGENDDDDDNFVVEESKPVVEEDMVSVDPLAENTAVATAAAAAGEDGEGAGLLVAQILETKKELEDGRRNAFSPETPGHRRVQIEQSQLSDANRRKERELIQKDVQKLSGSIQSLTRSVNPLAKMLDYLQEDLDSMHKELEMWRDENKQLAQTLKREQSMTEQALEPLRSQLVELESAVQEQRDKLSAVKSNILRNNDKISRLLAGINMNM